MSKKLPKKMPVWLSTCSEFIKKHEKKRDIQQSVTLFMELLTKHWDAIVQESAAEKSERPTKKRNVDPIKSMGKAMDRVAERVEEAKDNQELMKQYRERMKEVVPDTIKTVLSESLGDVAMGENSSQHQQQHPDVSALIERTSQNLDTLNQTAQKVLSFAAENQSSELKRDAEMTVQTLHAMTQNIEELRDSLAV